MNFHIFSSACLGVNPYVVEVEIDVSRGLPMFSIVGLGDTAILESRYRVKTALKNSGYPIEPQRILINLSPASIKKEGAHFDLAIAVGLLYLSSHIRDSYQKLQKYLWIGELSLSGGIKATQGVINSAILAKEKGYRGIVIALENVQEASLIEGIEIVAISSLQEVKDFLEREEGRNDRKDLSWEEKKFPLDFAEVKGQAQAKRALEIAAGGGHNILLMGSPGSGKSMLAKRLAGILPAMSLEERIESTKLHSVAGTLTEENPMIRTRPIRSPHPSSTEIAMIGGGKKMFPGEISLASGGILLLDEISEFKKAILESLRQPLEERKIRITRALYRVEYEANFLLVATSNPCPCGYAFEKNCRCTGHELAQYQKKISGPILDRIDLYVEMRRLSEEELLKETVEETSSSIQQRVLRARKLQEKRYGNSLGTNGNMSQEDRKKYCKIPEEAKVFLQRALAKLEISARGFDKVLSIARTIADLEERELISKEDLLEALSYRRKF